MKRTTRLAVIVHSDMPAGRCAVRAARARGYEVLNVEARHFDTADAGVVEAFAARTCKQAPIDVLVTCPAVSALTVGSERVATASGAHWEGLLKRTILPPLAFTASFGRRMRRARRGKIIHMVSNAAFEARRTVDGKSIGSPALAAGLAAVASMARQSAVEFRAAGVLVNTLVYGALVGEEPAEALAGYASRCPLGRALRPSELEMSLDVLLDPNSGYLTGRDIVVDGGAAIW